jgi:phosphoserine phosphatase
MKSNQSVERRPIELAIFDMDGVIFEGNNFWLDLHLAYGTAEAGVALADRFIGSDYGRLAGLVAGRLWKGREATPFNRLVAARRYEDGAFELFEFLKTEEIPTAIVSSGPEQLARRAQQDLGIDEVRANHVITAGGRVTGTTEINVPDAEKVRVGLEVMSMFGTSPARTMFVGDSDSDAALANLVGLGIAYNTESKSLLAACDHAVEARSLVGVVAILDAYLKRDRRDLGSRTGRDRIRPD